MTEELLGVDIKTVKDDINYNIANDVSINTPNYNISQAIVNRLKTPIGFYTLHPNYGSYLFRVLGKPRTSATLLYAKQVIYEALLQEPRVDTIESITTSFKEINTMEVFIRVTTIASSVPYNIVFDYFLDF